MTFAVDGPPRDRFSGALGPGLLVLSAPEVRIAQRAQHEEILLTADGEVRARAGDFMVSMRTGERYPITPAIYFGTYEVLSRTGNWYVGRRLIHPRRAWPIQSAGAEFDYGPGRGRVSTQKGGWIYQSDDDDFGLINAQAAAQSYIVVGPIERLALDDAQRDLDHAATLLAAMPPALTVIALMALLVSQSSPVMADALLALEALLLLLGIGAVALIRRQRWALRAAAAAGLAAAGRFQALVKALGQAPSATFPTMALWRAAQDDAAGLAGLSGESLRSVKNLIDETYEELRESLEHHHALERRAEGLTWFAAVVVLACLGLTALTHHVGFKLVAIGLPSLVGAVHAWTWRRRSAQRLAAGADMLSELRFARARLVSLAPDDTVVPSAASQEEIAAVIRMVCRVVAQHTQRELQFTATERASVPV